MKAKSALRKELLQKRASLPPSLKETYDYRLGEALESLIHEKGIKRIHTYIPMGHEVNIMPMLKRLEKREFVLVAPQTLPKRKLSHWILSDTSHLKEGLYGTLFPASGIPYEGPYDLIIVPGLGFDKQGSRLGYGGGYYDTFLKKHASSWKVAPAYPFQLLEQTPQEEHDVNVDEVLILDDICA